jgi:hypothetical protein
MPCEGQVMDVRSRIGFRVLGLALVASCGGRSLSSDAGSLDGNLTDAAGAGGRAGRGGSAGSGVAGVGGNGRGGFGGTFGSGGAIPTAGTFGTGGTGGFAGRGGTSFSTGGTGGFAGTSFFPGGRGGTSFSTGGTGGFAGTMFFPGGRGGTSFSTGGTGGFAGTMFFPGGRGGFGGTMFIPGGRGGFFGDTAGTSVSNGGRGGFGFGGTISTGGTGGTAGTGGRGGTGGAICTTCWAAILPIPAQDVVYGAARNLIYASVAGDSPSYPNTIVVVDPITSSVVSSIPVGSNPGALALSEDGSTLWVGIDGAHAFRKVTLTSPPVVGPLHHHGKATISSYFDTVGMAALPGAPLSVAMVMADGPRYFYGYSTAEVRVFDDGASRPTAVKTSPSFPSAVPSFLVNGPAGMLFGGNNIPGDFFVLSVTAAGITQTQSPGLLFGHPNNIVYLGSKVYGSSGEVIDVSNPAMPFRTTSIGASGWAIAARDAQTLLMLGTDFSVPVMSRTAVRVFSTSPLGQIASAPVPASVSNNQSGSYSKLVYAGGDAVAFVKTEYPNTPEVTRLVVMHDPAFGTPTGGVGGTGGTGGMGGTGGTADPCPGCSFSTVSAYGQHLVHDPSRNLIYIASGASSVAHPSTIVTVDPATLVKTSIVPVGNDPQPLALSDDYSVLWVGLAGERRVRRMTPGTTPVPGPVYPLPMLLTTGEMASPASLVVLPGTPTSIAVGVYGSTYGARGVFVLDDGLPRANWVQPPEIGAFIISNGPPGYLLGLGDYGGNLIVFRLGTFGATIESHGGLLNPGYYPLNMAYNSGYLYTGMGDVIDVTNPDAPVAAGRFAFNNCLVAMRSASRVLMLCPNPQQGGPILRVMDPSTFVSVGSVTLPASLSSYGLTDFAYLGGDAIAIVGYGSPLQVIHVPLVGSQP